MALSRRIAPTETSLGVILAGGKSRRMGTIDKCRLVFQGQTLTSRAVARATGQVNQLLVCTNSDIHRFTDITAPIIADTLPEYQGPAAGIISAFEWAQNHQYPAHWIATFAADTPFFPLNLTDQLLQQAKTHNAEVAIASSNQKQHYAFSLWSMSAAKRLSTYTANGERALKRLIQNYKFIVIDIPEPSDAFFNVNTPDDWQQLQGHKSKTSTS